MRAVLCASLAIASACVSSPGDGSIAEESGATQYVNIMDFAKTDQGAWYDLEAKLASEFAGVCGDTFCEGDFANLQPLTFSCSVTSKTGSVKDCAWTFAGSYAFTDPKTAAIRVDAPAFVCHVAPKTTSVKLIALLQNSADAIHETLPGTTGSLYDALVDCFQHPIGGTPFTPDTTPGTYVDADQYYASAAGQDKWRAGVAALTTAFDNICGDTFCGGDFGDLHALQLQCAVTKSTGNVKSCAWIFGGSVTTIATTGVVTPVARTWTCPVAMHGTIAQLTTSLTAPTAPDAIHRPLPGMTTSAYDAITTCLP